ncbi:MAG TPA: dihydrofolate reductase family protein [Kineosporiaceae bacterium]|nr:dihydrofolate reductase family protein [Kineosporiaceae bacterium]
MDGDVAARPHVLLSCATSIDGALDDLSPQRLILSSPADLDRVDGVRADADAVLVGAGTVRRDDPRLLVRSADRRGDRVARGLPPSPLRVILTSTGDLDPTARVFTTPGAATLVYCASPAVGSARERLRGLATIVDAGDPVHLSTLLGDLHGRGVGVLLVEGGAAVHRAFLAAGLVDELHLVVAPFVLGEAGAPRLTGDGRFPPRGRAILAEVRRLGDVALLRYRFEGHPELGS